MFTDKKFNRSFWIVLLLCLIFYGPLTLSAKIEPISDDELSQVTAQAGITVFMNGATTFHADAISFSDTRETPNWIEFKDVTIDDGNGGGYLFDTPMDSPITFDVSTNALGRTLASMSFSQYTKPRYYSIGDLVFCNQSLGRLDIDGVSFSPFNTRVSSHTEAGSSGVEFDFMTSMNIDKFQYTYNTSPTSNSLTVTGIHLAGSATGDPEDPTTWNFSGKFKVGDLDANKPASFDVATLNASGKTVTALNIPMEGTFRIEDITLGGKSFGPCAIDGINVHRLNVIMAP